MHAQENYWFSNAETRQFFSYPFCCICKSRKESDVEGKSVVFMCSRDSNFCTATRLQAGTHAEINMLWVLQFHGCSSGCQTQGQTPFLNGFTLNLFLGLHWIYRGKASPHSSSGPQNGITNDEYFSTVFPNGFGCGGKIGFCILVHFHKVNNPNDKRDEKAKSND